MRTLKQFMEEVQGELKGLQELGIKIPARAFELAKDAAYMDQYTNMKVCECTAA